MRFCEHVHIVVEDFDTAWTWRGARTSHSFYATPGAFIPTGLLHFVVHITSTFRYTCVGIRFLFPSLQISFAAHVTLTEDSLGLLPSPRRTYDCAPSGWTTLTTQVAGFLDPRSEHYLPLAPCYLMRKLLPARRRLGSLLLQGLCKAFYAFQEIPSPPTTSMIVPQQAGVPTSRNDCVMAYRNQKSKERGRTNGQIKRNDTLIQNERNFGGDVVDSAMLNKPFVHIIYSSCIAPVGRS